MSTSEHARLQFQVLRRQFLFRVVDVEVLSANAQGDASKLLGQFVALLFFISLLLSVGLLGLSGPDVSHAMRVDRSLAMEHVLVATTMLAVGTFAVLSWESSFPDRRDVLVITPLPVRARTIFLSKAAATASALALVILALNAAAGVGWPFAFAALAPSSHVILRTVRCFAAYGVTMVAAGAFVYGALLGVQGFAAQLFPRRWFLRTSGLLQMAAFCSMVCLYFLEPPVGGWNALAAPDMQRLMTWVPTYWFFGLFNQLAGFRHPAFVALARRAWVGLAVATLAAAVSYALSYQRTIRQILEEPDIRSGPGGFQWLPRFGNTLQTAIGQFAVRSLVRSRQHRLILAFYGGMGLAFTIVLVHIFLPVWFLSSTPLSAAGTFWREPNMPMLAASVMLTVLAAAGVRVAFAFPLELPANWIFRAVGVRPGPPILAASRRALLLLSAAPVWMISAAVCFALWPWRLAAEHLAVLGVLGILLADVVLYAFRKIPCTCSYLPGQSQAHMVFLAAIGIIVIVTQAVGFESRALERTDTAIILLLALGAAAAGIRWRVTKLSRADERAVPFEEVDASMPLDLGLSRDGGVVGAGRIDRPPNG